MEINKKAKKRAPVLSLSNVSSRRKRMASVKRINLNKNQE
jgi:hypothetical protein